MRQCLSPPVPRRLGNPRTGIMSTPMVAVTVWFDGSCPLCSREIALMRRLDRRGAIRFIDIGGGDPSCPVDRSTLLERFHAQEGGTMLSGAAAFAAMWRAIPLLRPLGLAARNDRVLRLLERLYLGFLRVRPVSPVLQASRARR
jgi:predicted DCC family thiol-disulfide oxidoreductase YuxK